MTSIIIFAPVLFYRLLIFRSFFALGGQLIILHGNDNGIAFFYLICQDQSWLPGSPHTSGYNASEVLRRTPDHKHCLRSYCFASSDRRIDQLPILQTPVQIWQ